LSKSAWSDIAVIEELRRQRTTRPRARGVTMVIDTGLGVQATADLLEVAGDCIDHWKFAFGTSAFTPSAVLSRKLALLRERQMLAYPGGTLLEAAIVQQHCRDFMNRAKTLGFSAVEISDGTIPLPLYRRRRVIQCAIDNGLIPITEVGKKDVNAQPSAAELADEALQDLDWGAHWVVVEGRESGVGVGVYDDKGRVRAEAVDEIATIMGPHVDRLIWETPTPEQQVHFIRRFGANVGLGNVPPQSVLAVEALRAGLRFETLRTIAEEWQRAGRWTPEAVEAPPREQGNAD
jgi:phosphosulfolactate synthase